jgi:outer membrane protein
MRVFAVATALSVLLAVAPTFAQAPAQTPPRPSVPVGQAPGSTPAPAPNVPFPAGVKYGYVNLEQVFAGSAEGQRIQTLIQTKQNELQAKQKAFQDAQQKAQSQASVMSDAAKAQAQADLERQDKDLQRLLEDAQTEVQGAQQQAQAEWQRRIQPVVEKLSQEKGLHFLLSVPDSGLVWADPSINLTEELLEMQKAAPAPAATAAPAAAPTARPATTPAPRPVTPATGK